MEKSDNLQATISKLDNLLTEGQLRYTTLRQNYSQIKDKEDFNLDKYMIEITDNLNEWFRAVVKVLDELLPMNMTNYIKSSELRLRKWIVS